MLLRTQCSAADVRHNTVRRVQPLAWVLAAALAGAACSGATDPVARFDTLSYSPALFALNGSPLGSPTAVNTPVASVVRADATYNFDIAMDIDGQGRPVVLTQRAVGTPAVGAGRQVSLQVLAGGFDAVLRAPGGSWVADSMLTLTVGQVVGIRVSSPVCQFDFSPYIYSKLVVDSVQVGSRRLWLTMLTNPNCGFRSLEPGRPRD